MLRFITLSFMFFFCLLAVSQEISEERTLLTTGEQFNSTSINTYFTPPKGYKYLENLTSFFNSEQHMSFSVARRKKNDFDKFIDILSDKKSKAHDAKLLGAKKNEEAYLFNYDFVVEETSVERLIYVVKNGDDVYSMANFKKYDRVMNYKKIKESLMSIRFEK